MLQLNNISFSYDNNNAILNKTSFTFDANHFYAIKGSNGIGKTTLIKLLLGLLSPNNGSIDRPADVNISYLPDNNGVYEYLTVMQNIQFRLGIYNIPFSKRGAQIDDLLFRFNIQNYAQTMVSKLSLGTKFILLMLYALVFLLIYI